MTNKVLFETDGGIATVTINRPDARNAVDRDVAEGIAAAAEEIDGRDDIRVAILTGSGGTFCSGMDLKAFLRNEIGRVEGRGFAGLAEAPMQTPAIAAVEGFALAGGFELALTCDLIVAARNARFGLPEVKRGLVANAGGLLRLPQQMPERKAMELVLTGDMMDAPTLSDSGLINRVVEPGQAVTEARALAESIAANAPLALAASKRVVHESRDWHSDEMFERQNTITMTAIQSEDAKEGARAFAEKRAPVWQGK